jgi:hypothetical protein
MAKHRLYTPEIAETILERLEDGEGLIAICRDDGMPSDGAVRHWVETDYQGFAARYAQARARGVERLADEILELSDDGSRDVKVLPDGREIVDYEVVARSRLRVDSRKWLLSKLLPKQYGDRVDLNHSGEISTREVSEDALNARIAALMQASGASEP